MCLRQFHNDIKPLSLYRIGAAKKWIMRLTNLIDKGDNHLRDMRGKRKWILIYLKSIV